MSEARPYSVGVEGLACQTILFVLKVAILLLMYTLCKCSEGHFLFDKWPLAVRQWVWSCDEDSRHSALVKEVR